MATKGKAAAKYGIKVGTKGGKKAKTEDSEELDAQEWRAKVSRENWVRLRRENAEAEKKLIEIEIAVPALIDVVRTVWLEVSNLPNILPGRLEGMDQSQIRAEIVAEIGICKAHIEQYLDKLGAK